MKKMFVWITLLLVLFVLVQFKIQLNTFADIKAPFVLMLVAVVWGHCSWWFNDRYISPSCYGNVYRTFFFDAIQYIGNGFCRTSTNWVIYH